MSSCILCKYWDFSKRISLKLFGFSGSNLQRLLKLFFFSIFRGVILLASSDDERRILMRQKYVNKDLPIYMSSIFGGTYQDNSELMQQDGRGKKTANLV